jgi:hypothetical protein
MPLNEVRLENIAFQLPTDLPPWPNGPSREAPGNPLEHIWFPDHQPKGADLLYIDFRPGKPPKAMRQHEETGSEVTYLRFCIGIRL